jgi:hypothetical protein
MVIVSSVSAYLHGYDAPDIDEIVPHASDMLRQACQAQEDIGWDQWIKGRVARTWGAVYESDLATTDHNLWYATPERWMKQIIKMSLEFVLECWSIRNQIEHGTDDTSLQKKSKLIEKIMWQKNKVTYFPNRYLERLTREELQDLPLDNLMMTDCQLDILVCASKKKTCVPRDTEIE